MKIIAALTGLALVAVPAPASAAEPTGPRPLTTVLPVVKAGKKTPVAIRWRTGRTVCSFKLVVMGNSGIDVDYPNGWVYTSLYRDAKLSAGEIDYTTVWLRPDGDAAPRELIAGTVTYHHCGTDRAVRIATITFRVPVKR